MEWHKVDDEEALYNVPEREWLAVWIEGEQRWEMARCQGWIWRSWIPERIIQGVTHWARITGPVDEDRIGRY